MQFNTDAERKTRDYKEAAVRFKGVQSELLVRLQSAEESGRFDDAQSCLSELQVAALSLLKLREGYSAKLDFIDTYQIKIDEGRTISLVIPAGTSHTKFLRHAQNLAQELYGVFAVSPTRLAQWEKFPTPIEYGGKQLDDSLSRRVSVALGLEETAGKTLQEQLDFLRERNLSLASVIETVIACAAYLVVTGESAVTSGNTLRAAGGCVQSNEGEVGLRGVWDRVAAPTILAAVNT